MTSVYPPPIRYCGPPAEAPTGIAPLVNRFAFLTSWLFVFTVPWGDGIRESAGLAVSHWVGLVAFGAGVFSIVISSRFRKPTSIHYLLLALVTWSALSYLWSVERTATAERLVTYVQLLAMVWLIWELASSSSRQKALLSAYVLGTFISCAETISNFLSGRTVAEMTTPGLADAGTEQRFVANGFNANEFALVLAISIPITFYLISQKSNGAIRLLYWLQLLAALTAILLTGSRGALIAAAIGSLMYFAVLRHIYGWQKFASLICVPLALAVALAFVPASVLERFTTIGAEVSEGTFTKRTLIWAAGLDTFRDRALVGVGSGAFGASVLSRLDVSYAAHNTFLSVTVELGVVGALIFLALLATLLSSALASTGLIRSLWLVLLATWSVGVLSTTWEQRKPTWFLFGMLAVHTDTARRIRRGRLNSPQAPFLLPPGIGVE